MWRRFQRAAERRGAAAAISHEGATLSFAELEHHAVAIAETLGAASRTPRVAAALPGGPELAAVQLGCLRLGALFAPLPDKATVREARHGLELLPFDVVVADDESTRDAYRAAGAVVLATSKQLVEGMGLGVRDGDTYIEGTRLLQLTSGTTGRPKGVLLTEANLRANLVQSGAVLAEMSDRAGFCPLPQFHAMGNSVALEHLCSGSGVHVANVFDPASDLRRMRSLGCRGLWTNPHYAGMFLRLQLLSPDALPELEEITLGTAPVTPILIRDLQRALPAVKIHIRYGLAEAAGALSLHTLAAGEALAERGLVGRPLPGVEVVIVDGEIRARAGSCAASVLGDGGIVSPILDESGFLATGDTGTLRTDGIIQLAGRRSTFLDVHGHRIDPAEIESLLAEQPGVGDAVVLGIPDDAAGQRIVACLERIAGSPAPERSELQAVCDAGLAPYKLPTRFEMFAEFPRTAAGKPDRTALMDRLI